MELKEVIGRRRTIRFFLPYRPVEREKLQKMLEAARHASCAGNVMNVRAVVIWRDEASPELIKALTGPISYQQMQTAPLFLLWYNEASVYHGQNWIDAVLALADSRRIGVDVEATKAEINAKLAPGFIAGGEMMGVAPLAYMDIGQAIAQATLVAYEEGLGTCLMGGPATERLATLLELPETAVPVCIQAIGYAAESWEAGGQTPKPPLGELFFEGKFGRPFEADATVDDELRAAKLIQRLAPLPWREDELIYVDRALGLEGRILTPEDGG